MAKPKQHKNGSVATLPMLAVLSFLRYRALVPRKTANIQTAAKSCSLDEAGGAGAEPPRKPSIITTPAKPILPYNEADGNGE